MSKYRMWDGRANKYFCDIEIVYECLKQQLRGQYDHISEGCVFEFETGWKDKNGTPVFEGDVISLVTADGEQINIECRYGKVRRQIYGNLVEIEGVYFVRSNDGRKTFPIVCNYLGKHDTEIWEVVGNIHENPELQEPKI